MNISIQRFIKIKIFFYLDVLINNAGIGIFTPFKERTAAELKKDGSLIQFVEDRPGHAIRYRLDSSKLYEEARWRPQVNFEQGISLTVNWCLKKRSWFFSKWSFIRKLYFSIIITKDKRLKKKSNEMFKQDFVACQDKLFVIRRDRCSRY